MVRVQARLGGASARGRAQAGCPPATPPSSGAAADCFSRSSSAAFIAASCSARARASPSMAARRSRSAARAFVASASSAPAGAVSSAATASPSSIDSGSSAEACGMGSPSSTRCWGSSARSISSSPSAPPSLLLEVSRCCSPSSNTASSAQRRSASSALLSHPSRSPSRAARRCAAPSSRLRSSRPAPAGASATSAAASCARRRAISAAMAFTLSSARLATTRFLMPREMDAYLSVLSVSSMQESAGLTHATITVLALPPRLSCSTRVNLLARYGTWERPGSHSASMQFRSASRPRLMLAVSFCCSPWTPDFFNRSLPAKSTRCILAVRRSSVSAPSCPVCTRRLRETVMVKMACEREECAFMSVAWVARLRAPRCRQASSSAGVCTASSVWPSTQIAPEAPPSFMVMVCSVLAAFGPSRSRRLFWYTSKNDTLTATSVCSLELSSATFEKSSDDTLGMSACQDRRLSTAAFVPRMYVLPAPVCPYASTVPL
mmetsp:Transcript_11029/g.28282  ORF Transcript_11029/g.28282 Transcript_11029/m.28282 type:complete len:492 (+) Transcript_11029:544-2019(+)